MSAFLDALTDLTVQGVAATIAAHDAKKEPGTGPYINDPGCTWTHECAACGYYVGVDRHGAAIHMGTPKTPHRPDPVPLGTVR